MPNSYQIATSDGTMANLDISIGYLDRADITVYFNGVLTTAWSWVGDIQRTIHFNVVVPNGVQVRVQRKTSATNLRHSFSAGAAFTAPTLDEDLLQALYIAQEAQETNVSGDFFADVNLHGFRLYNVGPAVNDTDALSLGQARADGTTATGAAAEAAASAAAAAGAVSGLASDLADTSSATKGSGKSGHNGTLNYAVGTIGAHLGETYYASDFPWNCQPGLTTDQSSSMQAFISFVASKGGEAKWKPGTYLGRIDFSGIVKFMVFDGMGSLFAPYTNMQGSAKTGTGADGKSEVFWCYGGSGTTGSFTSLPVKFMNTKVTGRLITAVSDTDAAGHTDYGVNFRCASAKWYDSEFTYAKIAPYHGYYHQYGEFFSCLFGAAVFSNTTAGCLLEGFDTAEASNENRLYGCKFFSNKNGLVIKGGIKNRVYAPTIQDCRAGGTAGIWLTMDAAGFGANGTEIHGGYGEVNAIPGITVGVAPNTLIQGYEMLSAGESITSTHTYNLTMRNVDQYSGGTITLNHPPANGDTASLLVDGGNVSPSISGLTHAGSTYYEISQPATGDFRSTRTLPYDVFPYSASMTITARNGGCQVVTATNSTAFLVGSPVGGLNGQALTVQIKNTSGGALGVGSWGALYKMTTWTQPATGFNRSITFRLYPNGNWYEESRTGDVPN